MTQEDLKNRLKLEYIDLFKEMKRIQNRLVLNLNCIIKNVINNLKEYEKIIVESRIKTCESSIQKIITKYEGNVINYNDYSKIKIKDLKDLIGLRISVFPSNYINVIEDLIKSQFLTWEYDPISLDNENKEIIIKKYQGKEHKDDNIYCEIQIVSMLYNSFLNIEHDTFYKPLEDLKNIGNSLEMRKFKNKNI